ncbi:MAG: 3-phosphoserine/phosphohydroxythreonine transaminase [Bacteroidales bacterium]|nr:3-phosphoserine/phosphohydroxythreonine transaminase [Bacteroidales bacterium]
MKKHIFNAGPCKLPRIVLENTSKAILDLEKCGLSIMEVSHRSKEFQAVIDEAMDLFKELLNIPDNYSVLFLGGGASTQFCMIPYNLLNKKAAYINTGAWSTKAIKEAKLFGEVDVIASSEDKGFTYVPKEYNIPADADYLHITSNNTIKGTELKYDIDCNIPLIADMSSDIMSRPVDVSKYDIIYGGCQKNIGPAGVTFVVIKDGILGKVDRAIPTMLNYETHIKKGSMFNTPPCSAIFTVKETLKWIKSLGGVKEMEKRAIEKSDMIYNAIDNSKMFVGTVAKEDRSRMNICFVLKDEYKEKEADFLKFTAERNIVGIKGHRSVGGFRASNYNACEMEDVEALVKAMKDFEVKYA